MTTPHRLHTRRRRRRIRRMERFLREQFGIQVYPYQRKHLDQYADNLQTFCKAVTSPDGNTL